MAIFNSPSLKYTLLPFSLAALLTGCGGAGSDNAINPTTDNSGWTSGVFASSGQFKGQCQAINEKTGCALGVTKPTYGMTKLLIPIRH
nr:hypothetical protein [Ningiella sp. W23]